MIKKSLPFLKMLPKSIDTVLNIGFIKSIQNKYMNNHNIEKNMKYSFGRRKEGKFLVKEYPSFFILDMSISKIL